MTNTTTAVVTDYLEFARNEDLEGATKYLEAHFKAEDGTLNEDALKEFMEKVVAAAETEVGNTVEKAVEDGTEV